MVLCAKTARCAVRASTTTRFRFMDFFHFLTRLVPSLWRTFAKFESSRRVRVISKVTAEGKGRSHVGFRDLPSFRHSESFRTKSPGVEVFRHTRLHPRIEEKLVRVLSNTWVWRDKSLSNTRVWRDKSLPNTRVWRDKSLSNTRVWRDKSLSNTRVWRDKSLSNTRVWRDKSLWP